jgi:hypothetical protein
MQQPHPPDPAPSLAAARSPRDARKEPGPEAEGAHHEPSEDESGWGAAAVAARVRRLVAKFDGGDPCAAARRLGVAVSHLIRLEELLSRAGDHAAAAGPDDGVAEEILTAAVLRYRVNATWLLTGRDHPPTRELPPTVRLWLAGFLLAVGTRIVDDYRADAAAGRGRPRTGD